MSVSKQRPTELKCSRCRHHGFVVQQKGHRKSCPYLRCDCPKCLLISQRTRIMARQRSLNSAEPGPCSSTHVSQRQAPGTWGAVAPRAESLPSSTSAAVSPSSSGGPLDLRVRAAGRGEHMGREESPEAPPLRPASAFNAPYFVPVGRTNPVLQLPFGMSNNYPGTYAPCPNCLINMPWLTPVPAGIYNNRLHRPQIIAHFLQGAVNYPPRPEPGPVADCNKVFLAPQPPQLQEAFQPPLPKL